MLHDGFNISFLRKKRENVFLNQQNSTIPVREELLQRSKPLKTNFLCKSPKARKQRPYMWIVGEILSICLRPPPRLAFTPEKSSPTYKSLKRKCLLEPHKKLGTLKDLKIWKKTNFTVTLSDMSSKQSENWRMNFKLQNKIIREF